MNSSEPEIKTCLIVLKFKKQYKVLVCSTVIYFLIKSARMKGHFVYGRPRSDRNHFRGSRIP